MSATANPYPSALLGDVCRFIGGGTPSRKRDDYFNGNIPWATVKDFKTFRIFNTEDHISESGLADSASNLVPAGTVLLVTRIGLGKVAITGRPLAINQDIKAVIPAPEILPEFLFWFLLSKGSEIVGMGAGATVKGVTLNDVRAIRMPLPPHSEQRRIVDILSRAEGIVRLRREAQKKATEIIPALFIDMFGDPATNPKGWPVASIDDLCDLVRGSSPRPQGDPRYFGGSVPRLMIADITRDGTFVKPMIDSLTIEGAKKSRPMKSGDVVMAVSAAIGLPAILSIDACIHDGFVGFRDLQKQRVLPLFFYNFIQTLRQRATHEAVGAIFQNLTTHQIKRWEVPIPPITHQAEFVQRVEAIIAVQCQQSAATAKADATFAALLNKTFSGLLKSQ